MRDFSKISPTLWRSKRFLDLSSDDARYLYLYLLTCEHQNNAGAYYLPDGYACNDLSWQVERYDKALAELEQVDLIATDRSVSVVMIRRWFKHNPPMNESHLRGIERVIERIESDCIAEAVSADLSEAWELVLEARRAEEERKKAKAPLPSLRNSTALETSYLNGRGRPQ